MSETLAHYSFLPWLRRGINSKISEQDALGTEPSGTMSKERARMDVGLTIDSTALNGTSTSQSQVNKVFKFVGPPDVLAVSEKAIVRVEPKRGVNNYEANGLPYIEFYEEDFLWAYTPAGARTEKLTPWLALICLKDDEFELKNNSEGRPYITLADTKIADVFHDEKKHWAWGHVHLNTELETGTLSAQITEVSNELDADPDSGVSRLLCPRKLIRETNYTAFLIPAFETGRLAGLGLEFTNVYAQKMSWKKGDNYASKTRGFDYPVYFSWKFRTGLNGDFESLARLLKPVVTSAELGKRDLFIADAGYGLEDFPPNTNVIGIEGALKPPAFASDVWPNGAGDNAYRNHLRKLLNLSIDNEKKASGTPDSLNANPFYSATLGDDPIVTPEIYGRWHALATRLQNGSNYNWINQLNLDPRNRATAGLGTQVVKKNQENYMQRAWKQVEQVNEANRKIKKAALSRMVNHALFNKHVASAKEDYAIRMTSSVHSFIRDTGSGKTVKENINKSRIPNASQSAAFKKITRPGKKSNRIANSFVSGSAALLHQHTTINFNQDQIKTAPVKASPLLGVGLLDINSAVTTALTSFQSNNAAMATQGVFEVLTQEVNYTNLASRKATLKTRIDQLTYLNGNNDAKLMAKTLIDGISSSVDGGTTEAHKIRVTKAAFNQLFNSTLPADADPPVAITAKVYGNIVIDRDTGGAPGHISRATTTGDIAAFQTTFTEFQTYANSALLNTTTDPINDLNSFRDTIKEKLNQKKLMVSRISNSVKVSIYNPVDRAYTSQQVEELKPIMAYPKFDDPMFRTLKSISQEYILPNLDKVAVNSITLLETNQAFIEAYMSGLNHEMSRELLWREYPTDQRGTYFRQFWDISDNVQETDPEKKYDIKKMPAWTGSLGAHSPRVSASGGSYLVLLIRGELLKKYPNTQVYAHKAKYKSKKPPKASTPRELADAAVAENIRMPVFMAELEPDIYLFGFDMTIAEAKGDSNNLLKPGWFFALRERPGQIRFGLDDWTPKNETEPVYPNSDPANWNDLSWEHFVPTAEALKNYQLDPTHSFSLTAGSENVPTARWGKNAADLAYVLYQNPVLFARHAQEMLPD